MVTQETTIWPGEIPAVSERRDVVEVASRRVRQGRVDGLAASEQPWPLTDLGALTACAPQSAGLGGACAVVPQRILCARRRRRRHTRSCSLLGISPLSTYQSVILQYRE